jgi:hypothetical protein
MRGSIGLALLFLLACSSSGGGAGGAGGSDGGTTCPSICCPKAPFPCAGLDEATCGTTSGCVAVKGTPFGSDAGTPAYLGCSSCTGADQYETCVVDPAHPSACYRVMEALVPDGWQEKFECSGCSTP